MTLVVAGAAAVYTLRIADDCLVLSHRLAQWSSWAPTLEDDIALTNIALDLLGQARAALRYAPPSSTAPAGPRTTTPSCVTSGSS